MSMYFLHQAGETTGPFTPARIRQMYAAGALAMDAQVCEHGSEEWMAAEVIGAEIETQDTGWKSSPRPRPAGKVPKRPFRAIGWVVAILGLVILVTPVFLIGLLLILIGLALSRPRFHCGKCGNRVEKISVLCPTCQVTLLPWTFADSMRESRVSLIVLALLLLGLGGYFALAHLR